MAAAVGETDTVVPSLFQRRRRLHRDFIDLTLDQTEERTESEAQESDSGIECICCFDEYPFEEMGQCSDGHLVCLKCLAAYTKHETYGSIKLELQCMAENCSASYSRSEMTRCLSPDTLSKWDERIQEENLKMSDLELTRCPHCHFACILSPTVKALSCRRESCRKTTCRKCGVDWSEHIGKTCKQVEKKDETTLRKQYEEKMTKATLRSCPSCNTPFIKENGCNKMKCHCGTTMCYICRECGINYGHFCAHVHSPGKGCKECKKCCLWTSSKEDDEREITRLRAEALRERKRLGYNSYKIIGAPEKAKPKPLNRPLSAK